MSSNLSLNQATLKVEIMNNGKLVELPEKYYMVRTDLEGETFRVTVGLVAAFNDGQISYDQLKNAAQIVVSYDATVKDSVINGDKVENRAWVNDSEEDIVDGPVIDPDVPSTGGVGTKAFTAAGIALMGVAAGAVIVTGKKKKEEQ
ncbi:LPXTG cell wall anchor domain-containing protein [Lachnospiraceae bacterium OF11-28]|jgi:LPXTG-motif cell wall-anchored protein|nr:LPXTG cell wall anchor domain-containing protein [Lachnospiraceae bacterium OF11-28]